MKAELRVYSRDLAISSFQVCCTDYAEINLGKVLFSQGAYKFATEEEAIAGESQYTMMSPFLVHKVLTEGGGGVLDYNLLSNLPEINGTALKGSLSLDELGIASLEGLEDLDELVEEINKFRNRPEGFATAEQGNEASLAYKKPEDGIPFTDLNEETQEKIRLAEKAVFEEVDPTVPEWAKEPDPPPTPTVGNEYIIQEDDW